jgi:5-methylcytosine-specific restriction endonuclease McrA
VDHILPVSLVGVTELDNLALACPRRSLHDWLTGTYLVPR